MIQKLEKTIFFVKPECKYLQGVVAFLEDALSGELFGGRFSGEFRRVLGIKTERIHVGFWYAFYHHVKAVYP